MPDFEQRWRSRFENFGQTGDDDAAIAGWSKSGLETRLRNFARVWHADRPGAVWLDAGCGAGTYARFLVERGIDVVGMDYSLPTIKQAVSRSPQIAKWCVADVTRLPVRPQVFDGVLCFGVTQALADSAPAVSGLYRATRPGGQIWIDALNGWCIPNSLERLGRWLRRLPPRLRYESPWALRKLLAATGGENVRLYWVPILPARWQRLQGWAESRIARALIHAVPLLGALVSHAFVLCVRRGHG